MQYVGQQQLLMLLLVVAAQLNEVRYLGARPACEHPVDSQVDVLSIGVHLIECRSGQKSANRPRVALTQRLIIGFEKKTEAINIHPVTVKLPYQHHAFENPGGMREMPFRRTGSRRRRRRRGRGGGGG